MKSEKYNEIVKSVEDSIQQGKLDSFLNRMQFDYKIGNVKEFSNYMVILLSLMEKGNYEISNNIFLRKIINCPEKFESFLDGNNNTFELVKLNSVFPFVGISDTIRFFILDLILHSENLEEIKDKIPDKEFLIQVNFELLKRYFNEINSEIVFRHYIRLFYNCFDSIDKQSNVLNPLAEAVLFFRDQLISRSDFFNNYLDNFLRRGGMKYSAPGYGAFLIEPENNFEIIFGSMDEFEVFVYASNSKIKKDVLEFLAKYRVDKKVIFKDLTINKERHVLLRNER